jgi:hypothetical protein
MKKFVFLLPALFLFFSCKKNNNPNSDYHYFEVGLKRPTAEWRDSSFIIATANPQLIQEVNAELQKPVAQRRIVLGYLRPGSSGYNHNGSYSFRWHLQENTWELTDVTAELYDGRPYSDLDLHYHYWMDTVGKFSPWNSYIRKELNVLSNDPN